MNNKKMKAAITGVLYFLQEEENHKKKKIDLWSRFGRESIMKNRWQTQTRRLGTLDIKRFK